MRSAVRNQRDTARDDRYKWVALANTTAAMFMATLDGSIVIIALPAIFRGIHLDPLAPGNISYLLWMIMGYRLVQAVLVVSVGRLGDMFGRVQDLQLRLRRLHGRLDPAVVRPVLRQPRGAVADRLAGAAGRRRVHADGQLGRDPDRRLPGRPAGIRAGHQPDRRPGGHVRRARRGRPAGRHRLARGVLGQRACRHLRDGLGLPQAPRQRRAASRPHRLVGQHHLRRRAERGPDRHHLRHPALRRAHDGLDEPVGARRAGRRRRPAGRIRPRRDQDPRADVPAQPVPHPGLHGRQPRGPGGVDRPGRPAVHAHHLAAGHLAAAARLRTSATPRCGPASSCCRSRPGSSSPARSPGSCRTGSVPAASPPPGWRSSAAASSA